MLDCVDASEKTNKTFPIGNRHHGFHALENGLSRPCCRFVSVTANCPTYSLEY